MGGGLWVRWWWEGVRMESGEVEVADDVVERR